MIWNAGQLPADWTVEKLLGKHASIAFNPDIANAFSRAGGRREKVRRRTTLSSTPLPSRPCVRFNTVAGEGSEARLSGDAMHG